MQTLIDKLTAGVYDTQLCALYPQQGERRERYLRAAQGFCACFGDRADYMAVSAPGRTEIGGNHTDHNQGRVLAGAVDMDAIALCAKQDNGEITVCSEGFPSIRLNIDSLAPREEERETSAALVRGIVAYLRARGRRIGGFCAYTANNVKKGSGLSSSAAFEVLIACVLSNLYNEGSIPAQELALCGRYAENEYFGKPCGLMDQLASAVGGFVAMDFADASNPLVTPIDLRFEDTGHALCTVDVKSSHGDLTDDYAAIPHEMRAVAQVFGCAALREVEANAFYADIARVRKICGDRAVLRALHFFEEDQRAAQEAEALRSGDFEAFLCLVRESGRSSAMYLQNIYVPGATRAQAMMLALGCSERLLCGRGACRVHGGGFAGTIQAFVPMDLLESYRAGIEAVYGRGSCHTLSIRAKGAVRVF